MDTEGCGWVGAMVSSQACRQDREQCFTVGRYLAMNVRQVSLNRPCNSDMLCSLRKLFGNFVNFDGVNESLVIDHLFVAWGREGEELGLLRSEGDMVFVAVVNA